MKRPYGLVALVGLLLALGFGLVGDPGGRSLARAQDRPNVILIVTDDQPADTLSEMPKLNADLVQRGTSFENAFLSDPLCCPSRATILTGQYAHNHEVFSNDPKHGGEPTFRKSGLDQDTLGTRLSAAGYATGFFGKYLNGYDDRYVPPGWDEWFAFSGDLSRPGSYKVNSGGDIKTFDRKKQNDTDLLSEKASAFVENHADGKPWFTVVATHAPHGPYYPPGRHRHDFDGVKLPKPPSFDEKNVSDKPEKDRKPPLSSGERARLQSDYEGKLETLQGVDDMVGHLVGTLKQTGQLDDTYVVYLTDNGYMLGEHRLSAKGRPYEASIRTPLVVRGPGVSPGKVSDQLVANVDLAPTIAGWAGADSSGYDGRSLTPLLSGSPPEGWRDDLLIEHFVGGAWAGLRTGRYTYVEYDTGEKELYDLKADPYELKNIYSSADPALLAELHDHLAALRDCAEQRCRTAENGPLREAPAGQDTAEALRRKLEPETRGRPERGGARPRAAPR